MSAPEHPVVRRLVSRVVAVCAPREVVLFGSYAKGLADRNSDVDLLVVVDQPPSAALSHAAFDATRVAIDVDVHLHAAADLRVAATDPHGFLGSILRTGRSVYCAYGVDSILLANMARGNHLQSDESRRSVEVAEELNCVVLRV